MADDTKVEPVEAEEFDLGSLADSLLAKEEKKDEKPVEETKVEEGEKEKTEVESKEEKPEEVKPSESDKPESGADKPTDDKAESTPTEEDTKPLSREDIKAAMREEREQRETATNQRQTFAGQVRSDLKEALKLDSTFTTVALDDGTPINSISQLTQVLNPETDEPYTREEAAQLLLQAQQIVNDNVAANDKRVDELTDINVNLKEESDRVEELYGDILKAFPDVAKDLLSAYQKTLKISADGTYVEEAPVSPLAFYGPALRPFRNATDQVSQQQAEAKAAEEKAVKEAEAKAEQEDRGDLGGTAGAAAGKPNPLGDALNNYLETK
jgi:hypothetical protein